jgi:hypothetical protein
MLWVPAVGATNWNTVATPLFTDPSPQKKALPADATSVAAEPSTVTDCPPSHPQPFPETKISSLGCEVPIVNEVDCPPLTD